MSKLQKARKQQGHSRSFFEYIRSIGESKSKEEEDAVVLRDLAELKRIFVENKADKQLFKEYVVRIFYAEMLGISAEFAHIHCVNLSSSPNLLFKRTGYLGTWLTVGPDHDLMYLIVSNLQRDMKSSNFLEIGAALTAASKMVRYELISAISADVVGLLSHSNPHVRKKAVLTLHAFYRRSGGTVGDVELFRQMLCDTDPSVMGATLSFFLDLVYVDSLSQRDLIQVFISILKQITEHRLSHDYDYHRISAPWLQIKIMHILAMLVGNEQSFARMCQDTFVEVIKRADNGLTIGYVVTSEAISAIMKISSSSTLIELAAEATAKFFLGNNPNLRFVGIQALSHIVQIEPKYAREHQQIVMACLEDADETIRRKTMILLLSMCNEDNVDVVVTRLLKALTQTTDKYFGQDLTRRICEVVDRFSLGARWYIDTMNKVLLSAAEYVSQTTIQGILKLIIEYVDEDEEDNEQKDGDFCASCVETYFDLLESAQKKLVDAFCRVAVWVIGEYGFLSKRISQTVLMDCLCDTLERVRTESTQRWIIMAMMKIVAHTGVMPDNIREIISCFNGSRSVAVQQRCCEFTELVKLPGLMKKVLPQDGCCEDIDFDESMAFLDSFVQDSLMAGAKPYNKRSVSFAVKEEDLLRTDAYKLQNAGFVHEGEIDSNNCKTDEIDELVVRPTVKLWGLKNLEESATQLDVEQQVAAGASTTTLFTGPKEQSADGTILHHVDSFAASLSSSLRQSRDVVKPSKNEKFLNELFSGGGRKKTKSKRFIGVKESSLLTTRTASTVNGVSASVLSIQLEHVKELTTMGINVRIMGKAAVEDINIVTKVPPNCALSMVLCSASGVVTTGGVIRLATLPANQPLVVGLQLALTGFPSGGLLVVEATYRSPVADDPQRAAKSIELHADNFLRPAKQMTTQQFGEAWLTFGAECKTQLLSSTSLTQQYVQQILMERASLQVVEVIRNEIIAAALLLGIERLLLCHVVIIDSNTANVTVRAEDASFAQYVAYSIAAL